MEALESPGQARAQRFAATFRALAFSVVDAARRG